MLNMLVAGDLIKRMSIAEQSIDGLAIRTQKLEDLDNSDVVSRLVEALHAGDGTGSTDEQIQNLLDLSQIQRNTDVGSVSHSHHLTMTGHSIACNQGAARRLCRQARV